MKRVLIAGAALTLAACYMPPEKPNEDGSIVKGNWKYLYQKDEMRDRVNIRAFNAIDDYKGIYVDYNTLSHHGDYAIIKTGRCSEYHTIRVRIDDGEIYTFQCEQYTQNARVYLDSEAGQALIAAKKIVVESGPSYSPYQNVYNASGLDLNPPPAYQ